MRKRLFTGALIIISLIIVSALIVTSGLLVKPNFLTQGQLKEIPVVDILSDQAELEMAISKDVDRSVTLDDPYVIVDPYQMNPLSAMVLFNAPTDAQYTVTVLATDPLAQVTFTFDKPAGQIQLPIIGLYPDMNNQVRIESADQTVTLSIQTEALPSDFQTLNLIQSTPDAMAPGFTLFVACFDHSYTALIDPFGAVRAYFSNTRFAHGTSVIQLANGHLLASGDELKQVPYNMTSLWELDLLAMLLATVLNLFFLLEVE